MGQVCDRLYDVDFVSLEDDSVEIEMSKPDEATSKIVMWLLSVIEAAGRQRENLLPANKVRTAARDGERGRARVGPGLGPLVMERLVVAGVVVLPGLLLTAGRRGTSAEDVRLADGRVERPPPVQQAMVSLEYPAWCAGRTGTRRRRRR